MAGYREPLEEAQFFKLSEPSTYMPPDNSHVVSRSTVRVIPQTGSQYTCNGNRVIRIVLPSTGMLDTQNSYFLFGFKNDSESVEATPAAGQQAGDARLIQPDDKKAVVVGGTRCSIATLFQRMRILIGGSVVEDINAYNLIANMLFRCGRTGSGVNSGSNVSWTEGYTSGMQSWAALYKDKFYQFAHRPMCGLLNNLRYIPLAYIGELTIEITLEDAKTVFFNGMENPNPNADYKYSVDSFCYMADILQFDSEYVQAFEEAMLTRGVHIPFDTFSHYKTTTNSLGDVVINHRGRNVKNVFSLLREGKFVSSPTHCSMLPTRCGVSSWQLRIGAFLKPLLPVQVSNTHKSESFFEFLKSLTGFNRIGAQDIDITADQWGQAVLYTKTVNGQEVPNSYNGDAYFVIGVDLEREGQIASGLDTASEATPITLSLTRDPAYYTEHRDYDLGATHIDTFVHSSATLIVSSPHEVTLFT